ncbi:DgyrCDS2003 [Dimorphilus gyrociliatus]|uniref:DgyrCDS2003 n=1 Tax=Dimorphilus gyrociliatus TaxID=2664684 RepID=A0A7I8VAB4_9ANNE|nr:DgyrCDS2003 [Dimorphilus gyrociliatus]
MQSYTLSTWKRRTWNRHRKSFDTDDLETCYEIDEIDELKLLRKKKSVRRTKQGQGHGGFTSDESDTEPSPPIRQRVRRQAKFDSKVIVSLVKIR